MLDLTGKSVLMFCPKFFGYEQEIKGTLESFGASVIWFDDRPSNNFLSKALIRINKNFLRQKIRAYYSDIFNRVKEQKIDYLFFVNPEAISLNSLSALKELFPAAKAVLYMWDSFNNRKQNIELLPLFDLKYTFDPNDAGTYGLRFRPLFYSKEYRKAPGTAKDYDLLFIGTAHSDRYTFVKKLTRALDPASLKLYFFLSSKMLFAVKKVFERHFRGVRYADVSFESLGHSEIAALMNRSKVVLDINHPRQVGLTMRTLETLGVQCKLVTTNKDVVKYDFYDPANILLIDREVPVIDPVFFDRPFAIPDESIMFKYSIEGWATEIFNEV